MSEFDIHRERRALFGSDAACYAAGRPGYPDAVYDLLRQRCGLGEGTRVVEIGPGTGQATRPLLDAGASVLGVELSEELAAHLVTTFAGEDLEVVVGAFEEVPLRPATADLVTSATAFHWVPTDVGLHRVADVLDPGGSLALWWNVFGDENRPDPFHEALHPILGELAPSLQLIPGAGNARTRTPPYGLDAKQRIAEIGATGRFGDVHHETIEWTGVHRAAELRAMFATFSPWLALPADQRDRTLDALEAMAIDQFGGVVERPYLTPVYIASRIR